MKRNSVYYFLCLTLFYSIPGFSQSFVKVYSDLHTPYYGLNVLPTDREQTVVLGWYYGFGGDAFTTIVDSEGNKEYSRTGYPRFVTENISSLTANASGYVFYNGYGANNMSNPNVQSLVFNNDTLNIDTAYYFYAALYSFTTNINLYSLPNEGLFFTCTSWTHNPPRYYPLYTATFISKYDTNGRQMWNNSFSPSDTDEIYHSIITTDSAIAVVGKITDAIQLKKYDFNGNFIWGYRFHSFINDTVSEIEEVKNNIIAFGDTIDRVTHKNQLALEVINLSGSLLVQRKFVLNKDTANITPIAVYAASDTTAVLNYTVAGSTLNYYLIVDYKADSIGGFTLPAYTVSASDRGKILCALDSNNQIIVREYNTQAALIYKYAYKPFDSLNICNDIKPLPYPGRFVLTGSSNNNLLVIREDTSVSNSINELKKNEKISVFPNPSQGIFTLSISSVKEKCDVEIFNVLGEIIYRSKINSSNSEINLSGQPQGLYLYRVSQEDGNLIGSGKLLIEK